MKYSHVLLEMLGSFYRGAGKNDFTKGIDAIYSKIVTDRYLDTLYRLISSGDRTMPEVPRFGYIKWNDYNPSTSSITITNGNGNAVDMSFVGYAYFPNMPSNDFFRVENGLLTPKAMEYLSELDSDIAYPIFYTRGITSDLDIVSVSSLSLSLSKKEDSIISRNILRDVAKLSLSNEGGFNFVNVASNALCGAIYTIGEGSIISVTDEYIDTTLGIFYYTAENGAVIVSAGDTISGLSLLTKICDVTLGENVLPNLDSVNATLSAFSTTASNKKFIDNLYAVMAKRKITVSIPVEFFNSIGKDGIALIGEAVRVIPLSETEVNTRDTHFDIVTVNGESNNKIKEFVTAITTIVDFLKLDLAIVDVASALVKESVGQKDNSVVSNSSDGHLDSVPFEIHETLNVSDEALQKVAQAELILYSEDRRYEGTKQDDIITQVSTEENIYQRAFDSMLSLDNVTVMEEGKVMVKDISQGTESFVRTVTAKELATIGLSEINSTIMKSEDMVGLISELTPSTRYTEGSIGSFVDALASAMKESQTLSVVSSSFTELRETPVLDGVVNASSKAFRQGEAQIVNVSDTIAHLNKIVDEVTYRDELFVDTHSTIDEL